MAHDDPFTLDLFSTTALSPGLGIGVMAFASDFAAEPDIDESATVAATGPAARRSDADTAATSRRGENLHLVGDRGLARSWRDRARNNLAAIRLAAEIEAAGRPATADEQEALIKFTGFGASDLANGVFRRPGESDFRDGWEEIGGALEAAVDAQEYASLARCTQYAHFTPEFIVRAIWLACSVLAGVAAAYSNRAPSSTATASVTSTNAA